MSRRDGPVAPWLPRNRSRTDVVQQSGQSTREGFIQGEVDAASVAIVAADRGVHARGVQSTSPERCQA